MRNNFHRTAALFAATLFVFASSAHTQALVKPDTILASNAQAKVTYEDLVAELARIPEENRLEFMLSAQRLATVVENILINKVMSAEAQQTGLQNDPKIAAELRNQSEKVLAKYRRNELEMTAPKIDFTPLAREIFLTRLKGFEKPAMYSSWHTLIKTENRTPAAALELAKLVKAKVDAGEPLDAIAKEYSNDESRTVNFGFIRPTPLSYLDTRFAAALEKLKPNESTIVQTDYGVHVIRLLKMEPRVVATFEDVKPEMMAEAEKAYRQRFVENYLKKIRTDPSLKLHTDALAQIRPKLPEIPPPPAPPVPTRQF
ncbi:MAG: peptidylprolyl isomerase [Burkholderiales bacterium]|nr:peptidylprolyl isomerase [Burkholderiales bacterium]